MDEENTTSREGSEPSRRNLPEPVNGSAVESEPDFSDDEIESLEKMPPEVRRTISGFMGMIQSRSGPMNPLFEKFNDAHIDKYLDYIQRDDDHEYELKRSNRWFYLSYFVIAIVVVAIAVVYLLPRDKDFLQAIFQFLIILGGGLGAGYGIAKTSK